MEKFHRWELLDAREIGAGRCRPVASTLKWRPGSIKAQKTAAVQARLGIARMESRPRRCVTTSAGRFSHRFQFLTNRVIFRASGRCASRIETRERCRSGPAPSRRSRAGAPSKLDVRAPRRTGTSFRSIAAIHYDDSQVGGTESGPRVDSHAGHFDEGRCRCAVVAHRGPRAAKRTSQSVSVMQMRLTRRRSSQITQ